ncbi:MAG TPA: RNA polymerase sigma factor [Cytophagaceae bacterium]|jgi:RNA polymerase sigma-70 factor (ECF subfamily)|nr:RNA polymerase sigma factor [Cytophagaceae bacterium]
MLSDSEIAKECLKSKRSAQKELYDRYIKKMNAVCRRYLSDKDEIKDILQEGFIKVFQNIDKYRGDGPLEAWVRKIIVNTVLSHMRKTKSDIFVREKSDIEEENIQIADKDSDSDSIFNADFSKEDLTAAIDSLPDHYKIIFNLYCIENYSHKEIAEMLSMKEEGSRTRLNRARKILQEYLRALHKTRLST